MRCCRSCEQWLARCSMLWDSVVGVACCLDTPITKHTSSCPRSTKSCCYGQRVKYIAREWKALPEGVQHWCCAQSRTTERPTFQHDCTGLLACACVYARTGHLPITNDTHTHTLFPSSGQHTACVHTAQSHPSRVHRTHARHQLDDHQP